MPRLTEKPCRTCGQRKPVGVFCTAEGHPSTRGQTCIECHIAEQELAEVHTIEFERGKVPLLRIIYGKWWAHYAPPGEFQMTLYRERTDCPYCGGSRGPVYVSKLIDGRTTRGRAHIDHMDPLALGGEDSIRNAVYVCDECNLRKGRRQFLDWLAMLAPDRAAISRAVYIAKHGHEPEFFERSELPNAASGGALIQLNHCDEAELREWYPEPLVDGPPRPYLAGISPRDDL